MLVTHPWSCWTPTWSCYWHMLVIHLIHQQDYVGHQYEQGCATSKIIWVTCKITWPSGWAMVCYTSKITWVTTINKHVSQARSRRYTPLFVLVTHMVLLVTYPCSWWWPTTNKITWVTTRMHDQGCVTSKIQVCNYEWHGHALHKLM